MAAEPPRPGDARRRPRLRALGHRPGARRHRISSRRPRRRPPRRRSNGPWRSGRTSFSSTSTCRARAASTCCATSRPACPTTRIVLLTVSTDQRDVTEAMRLGAAGYLTKDMNPDALLRAVRGVLHGDLAMPRRLAAATMRELAEAARRRPGEGRTEGGSTLTAREDEILRMLADGLTDREIGTALSISTRTVESHVGNILRKLDARNRADAARRYAEGRVGEEEVPRTASAPARRVSGPGRWRRPCARGTRAARRCRSTARCRCRAPRGAARR